MSGSEAKFQRAVEIMARLRAPGGCPWDREQTFDSIKSYTLEETYEVFDAIERRDWAELKKELGDLLLQVLFYSEMAREAGYFTLDEVLDGLSDKLIRRHPHVFGDVQAGTAAEVVRNWEAIKRDERKAALPENQEAPRGALLDDVSRSMPALIEARKLGSRASGVGFDWPNVAGILDKLKEETAELQAILAGVPEAGEQGIAGARTSAVSGDVQQRIESEVGDLFFTLVNLARRLHVDSEFALRSTNRKFRDRFARMEAGARRRQQELSGLTLEQLEELWQLSKAEEDGTAGP